MTSSTTEHTRKPSAESSGSRDRKGGMSCAECRRSKLKCDRSFPCQSCIRRGCAAICPDGTLAATKGNKVLMAHAQKLSEQVKAQGARIKELEEALSNAQLTTADGPHPLLRDIALKGTSDKPADPQDIYKTGATDVSDAIGSLAIGLDGQAKYHGESASSEYFHDLLEPPEIWKVGGATDLGLPYEIADLVKAFPFGMRHASYAKQQFVPFLPSRERAIVLADLYYQNAAWMYDPILRGDLMKTIIDPLYGATGVVNVDIIHSHRLSVLFIILAMGMLYDSHPNATLLAEQYHALSRAALSLDPLLQEATCATVQALFVIIRYMYTSDRTTSDFRWMLGGLCTRVAQLIGLQRDSAGWSLPHDEIQRRRVMFWELYTHDAWTSVVNGRPPSLAIQHTDTRFPDDLDQIIKPSGEIEMGWHAWKFRYSANCLSVSVQHVFSTRAPSYASLLALDKKIRRFPLPPHLQSPIQSSEAGRAWSSDAHKAMQQYCVVCERESNLLYIHRSSFAQAIREASQDPLKHKYAPSVLATYRSACRLISSLKGLYPVHPILTSQVWFFWSGIFSSCIVLGALVVESPGCTLSPNAMRELDQALAFYEEGSRPCRTPATLTMLQKLRDRANSTYVAFYAGAGGVLPPRQPVPGEPDELEVLGGRTSVITTRSPSNSPASHGAPPSPQTTLHTFPDGGDTQHMDANPPLMEYYDALGAPVFERLEGKDVTMGMPLFSGGGYGGPVQTQIPQPFFTPATMQAPQYPSGNSIPQAQLNLVSVPYEYSQEEIWRNFMTYMGLNKAQ